MDLFDFKKDDEKTSFRVIQSKEIYEKIASDANLSNNHSQLDIESIIKMFIKDFTYYTNKDTKTANREEEEEEKPLFSILLDNLKCICKYYANIVISHNFEIVLQNQELLIILIQLISQDNEEEIRRYSFMTILLLIRNNEDILIILIEQGLYKSFASILSSISQFDSLGYFFVSNILYSIFYYYTKSQALELFLESPLSDLLVDLLSDSSNREIPNDFNQNIFFPSKTPFFTKKEENNKKISLEELIISILESLYKFCGNPDDEMTDKIIKTMLDLMTNPSKIHLTSSVSQCLSTMIISCKHALIQSVDIGLVQNLNIKFNSTEYEIAWPYILKVDIVALRCLLDQMNNPNSTNEKKIVEKIFKAANPYRLYNLINYSVQSYEENEKDDEQRFVSRVLNCFSILFFLNSQIIIEEYDGNFDRTQVLTLDELHQIINLIDEDVAFSLKKNGILFILSAINYQDCLHSRLDIIDQILTDYHDLIISILESCTNTLKKIAINVFINLLDQISALENRYEGISSLLESQEFIQLIEEWKNNDDEEIQEIANKLFMQITESS